MTDCQNTALPNEYESLMRELHCRAGVKRQSVNGIFELTERCNLACRMCFICQKTENVLQRKRELTAKSWLELTRQANDNGMVFLLLTGGEIFLRSDFFDLYRPLTRLGLIITLFTNGTLITDSVASRLADFPPSQVEITLYGATAFTYQDITNVPGSYARCCSGIEALLKHNIPLRLKSTITKQNVRELEAMQKMAKNWGLSFSAGFQLIKRRDGMSSEVIDCRLSASDCIELEGIDDNSATDWSKEAIRKSSLSDNCNFDCSAGHSSFVVSSQGEMNACIDLPFPAAQPLKVGFKTAWEQVQHFVDSAPSRSPHCIVCDVRTYCERCPGWSQLETGTLTDPVPYLCEIAKERKMRYASK